MKYPRITIVTPSFNQAQYIEQTIDSVLSQNYSNLEYIIIDGNSSDNSAKLISKYEKHLSFWISEPDRGQSHAINKGIQRTTGEIFNWLNSDDFLETDSLKTIAENFQDPSTNVVCGRSNIVQNKKIIRTSKGTDIYSGNLAKTLGWARIDQPETYFRKKIFDEFGFLNEHLHYIMDKEFWIRYLLKFDLSGILKIDTILANFRWHENSKTVSQKAAFDIESDTLYFQLALQNELLREASIIKDHFNINLSLNIPNLKTNKKQLVLESIHYYLLYKCDELYYNSQFDKCLNLLQFISISMIDKKDAALLSKLKFRSRYVPHQFIKWFRK